MSVELPWIRLLFWETQAGFHLLLSGGCVVLMTTLTGQQQRRFCETIR